MLKEFCMQDGTGSVFYSTIRKRDAPRMYVETNRKYVSVIIIYILSLVFLYSIVMNTVVCTHFKKAGNNNDRKRDVIIVLGYPAKNDGTASPILRERIRKAAELYHKGVSGKFICTGSAVANRYFEAEVMAQALIGLGIPECNIILEKLAKSTYENLVNSKKIMQDEKMDTAVIVSSPWHLRKASSYAFRLKIDHTVEKSKFPFEYLIIGVGIIYIYIYTQMFIDYVRFSESKK
jgi:uncharacterized SAM-binding protein YcdF (DUF218 family)